MLGSPDNQELGNEAETYGALVESTHQRKAEALFYFKRGLAELEALAEHDPEQARAIAETTTERIRETLEEYAGKEKTFFRRPIHGLISP
jgi:hypothetical protein